MRAVKLIAALRGTIGCVGGGDRRIDWQVHQADADRWGYLAYEHCGHGLCGAHLLRELTFIVEAQGYAWAANMKRLLQHTCKRVSTRKSKKLNRREYANLQKRYRNILTRGAKELPPIPAKQNGKRGRIAKSDAHNLWERLKAHETAVLLFAKQSYVAFTNNRAERDLRMSKVKQKVSGCFRNREYAQAYCRISSYSRPWPTTDTIPSSLFRWPSLANCTPIGVSSYLGGKLRRKTGEVLFGTLTYRIATLNICTNLPRPNAFQGGNKFLHRRRIVATDIDTPEKGNVCIHSGRTRVHVIRRPTQKSAAPARSPLDCWVGLPHATRKTKRLPHALTYLRMVAIDGECLPVASERSSRATDGA